MKTQGIRRTALIATLAFALMSFSVQAKEKARPVVNVNTATYQQFMYLPGIGDKLASRLNDACEANEHRDGATFRKLSDLLKIKGIGPKTVKSIAPYVVFSGPTTAKAKIRLPKPAPRKK